MSLHDFTIVMLVGAVAILLAVVAVRVSDKAGVPSLLGYLTLGVALGEAGVGIRFDDAQLAQNLGLAALVVILAEGGVTAHWPALRRGLPAAVRLSTLGVAISIAVVAGFTRLVLDVSWDTAIVVGAVLAPTDAAAVFATLRGLALRRNVGAVLEAESGTNDPVAVLVVLGIASGSWGNASVIELLATVTLEIAGGIVMGWLVARVGVILLRRAQPASGLYPLAIVALVVASYAGTAALHASGFLAAYVTAVALGRERLPHRQTTVAFVEGLAWLSQIGLFIMLGLLVSPADLDEALLPALLIGLVLVLVARPISVAVSTFRLLRGNDQLFIAWGGLRGAVPIILATIPRTYGMPDADLVFNIVFVLVLVFTAVQGRTLAGFARLLRVDDPIKAAEVRIDAAPLGDVDTDLLQVRIPAESKLHGVTVRALQLPAGAQLALIVRDGHVVLPENILRLRSGDELLIAAPADARIDVERRIRAVARRGPLADWFGEQGIE